MVAAAVTWISEVKVGRKWACLRARSISVIKWAEVVGFMIFGRACKHASFVALHYQTKTKGFPIAFYDLSLFPYEKLWNSLKANSKKLPILVWWKKQGIPMKKQQFQKSTALRPLLVKINTNLQHFWETVGVNNNKA